MFEYLKKELAKEYKEERRSRAAFIVGGSGDDLNHGLRLYSTPAKWEAYKAGQITREKAVELATVRGLRELDKREKKELDKIAAAEAAPALSFVDISVEWKKSRTWGANPSVVVRTSDGVYYGAASGCGYDKESAAIAEALNQSPAVLKVLYTLKEKGLKRPPAQGRALNPFHPQPTREDRRSSNSICGYGAGYGVLPYFEGGVGSSCFWSILEKCGYTCRNTASGKWFDAYSVEPKQKRKGA